MATKLQKGRKKFGHRGANRRFTNWEELSQQSREIELERQRKALEEDNENSGEDGEKDPAAPGGDSSNKVRVVNFDKKQDKVIDIKKGSSSSDEESEESSEDEENPKSKRKTLNNPIAESIENPNHATTKLKKLSELDSVVQEDAQLSRREREAIEKERARQEYQRLHAAGKTEEARADLARLAVIRKQREDAAKKREEEKKTKESADTERKAKEQQQKAREEAEQEHPELEGKANKLKGKGAKK